MEAILMALVLFGVIAIVYRFSNKEVRHEPRDDKPHPIPNKQTAPAVFDEKQRSHWKKNEFCLVRLILQMVTRSK